MGEEARGIGRGWGPPALLRCSVGLETLSIRGLWGGAEAQVSSDVDYETSPHRGPLGKHPADSRSPVCPLYKWGSCKYQLLSILSSQQGGGSSLEPAACARPPPPTLSSEGPSHCPPRTAVKGTPP